MRFVTVDAGLDPRRRADGVVLVVVQRDDLRPARLEVLVVADLPGPVAVEVVPVDLDAVLVPRVLKGKLQVAPVGGGVAQHDRLDVLGVGHGVLQGDEPAVRAARDDDLVRADPLAQAVDVSGPLSVGVRRDALAVPAAARVEDDDPEPVGQRAEGGLGLGQRADPAAAVVGDQHRTVLGPHHLDVQLTAVDGYSHARASVVVQRSISSSSKVRGMAPLRSTAWWNWRRSNRGPSACCARSRRRTISRLPVT